MDYMAQSLERSLHKHDFHVHMYMNAYTCETKNERTHREKETHGCTSVFNCAKALSAPSNAKFSCFRIQAELPKAASL